MAEVISIQQDASTGAAGFGEIAGNKHRGNTFTALHDNVTAVMLQLDSTGSKDLRIDIYATSGDLPTGSSLGGYTVPNASLSTSYTKYTFSSPVTGLSIGTKYAFVLSPYSAGVYSDDYRDMRISNANPYADGTHFKHEGSFATESGLDCKFRIYANESATGTNAILFGSGF